MKKLLTMLLACAAMGSCTQDHHPMGGVDLETLDETGLQFVEMLRKWQVYSSRVFVILKN